MQRPQWFAFLGLGLSVILTACAPATMAVPPTTLSPIVTSPVTPEPVGVGVPVIDYVHGQAELRVVSSLTGKPFDEFPSVPLEYNDTFAFAPDGKTLAVISDGKLYRIDLPSWKSRITDIDLQGPVIPVVYSLDGSLLALVGGTSAEELRIVDARNGEVIARAQADFSIRELKFTADEKAIMVYGPQLASTSIATTIGVSAAAPQAALYAVSDLGLLWSVRLDGIRDGIFPKKPDTANTPDLYQPGAAWFFQPGVTFAPDHDLLYLIHGDQEKLTTVDFSGRNVKTVDLHVETSWLDQLLFMTAGVAHAKGMDGTTKQAVISPDGKLLFVVGNTETVTPKANGTDWDITDTPIGLQVIDPQTGTLLEKIDTDASLVRLSPQGSQMLLSGWRDHSKLFTDVYDISSRSIVKQLDGMDLIPTRRLDGKVVLVSSDFLDGKVTDVTLLDPLTWATIAKWQAPGDIGWLMVP